MLKLHRFLAANRGCLSVGIASSNIDVAGHLHIFAGLELEKIVEQFLEANVTIAEQLFFIENLDLCAVKANGVVITLGADVVRYVIYSLLLFDIW